MPDPRLATAIARHRTGALDQAAALYDAILQSDPQNPDALHLRGVIHQQRGDFTASAAMIGQALALKPDAAFASNLANAHLGLGRFEDAIAACRTALALNAAFGMAHANLGVALHALGRHAEAAEALRVAIAVEPSRPEAQASLGAVLLELDRGDEAKAVLRGLLATHPNYPQAHYNLGNAIAAGETPADFIEALEHYDRAIALHPPYAEAHANRASALRRLDRLDEAERAYENALALNPNSALIHYNHGLLLGEQGRAAQALEAHDRAIALAPNFAAAHSHRGNVLTALDRFDEAMVAHNRALSLAPNDPHMHHNLGLTLSNQAFYAEAAAAQSRALGLNPDYAEAHAALAGCLVELGQASGALFSAQHAVALNPELGSAQSALGQALMEHDDRVGARKAMERALQLRPRFAQGHLNLGVMNFREGRLDEAEAGYAAALALRPDTWEAYYNRGVLRLQRGDYANGWSDFEHRLRAPDRRRQDARYPQPLWMGEDLAGQTILLHAEQGLGDIIQCARFIPQVAALGATVIVEAPATLRRLLQPMAGVTAFIEPGQAIPPAQWRAPLFSLPHRLGVRLGALPGAMSYLQPPAALTAHWREQLAAAAPGPGPRVGIVWSGNTTAKVDRGRSIPLSTFEPLATAIGAPLISLQKLYGLDDLNALPDGMRVTTLGAAYDAGDLADTAAVIQALDLVIACDTAVAHLAGAIGAPVWLAINAVSDWRWLKERRDSPWYPSVTIYCQPAVGDWTGVVAAMTAEWMKG